MNPDPAVGVDAAGCVDTPHGGKFGRVLATRRHNQQILDSRANRKKETPTVNGATRWVPAQQAAAPFPGTCGSAWKARCSPRSRTGLSRKRPSTTPRRRQPPYSVGAAPAGLLQPRAGQGELALCTHARKSRQAVATPHSCKRRLWASPTSCDRCHEPSPPDLGSPLVGSTQHPGREPLWLANVSQAFLPPAGSPQRGTRPWSTLLSCAHGL